MNYSDNTFVHTMLVVCILFCLGHIVITILPPIVTEGMTKDDLVGLIDKSRTAMQDVYTKSSEEMKTKYYNVS